MPRTTLRVDPGTAGDLEVGFDAVIAELGVPDAFSEAVLADARRAAQAPDLPDADRTDVPFVTIDPPGSTDLDQAVHLEQTGTGYRVHYAIADVGAFVTPGSATDLEARRRGQTLYAPHRRLPLHPAVLSEGAASLLPDQLRPAMVWVIDVDAEGRTTDARVNRAMVRSRARFSYVEVQQQVDAGAVPEPFRLLTRLGPLLQQAQAVRGGATLRIPDQELHAGPDGYALRYRALSAVEEWNAQISLLTGRAAADLMIAAGTGILRTLPPPDDSTLQQFSRQARALQVAWPTDPAEIRRDLGRLLNGLDPTDARQLTLLHDSGRLFRGAGYTTFVAGAPVKTPDQTRQAAIADEYAHVTAPLRRLVDRFATAICEAYCRQADPPAWAVEALPQLPEVMRTSDRSAGALERAAVDLAEAVLLSGRVGQTFEAVVVDVRAGGGLVQLADPAVLAHCAGDLTLGSRIPVCLVSADVATRTVRFHPC